MWELASSCDGRTADLRTSDLRDQTVSPDWFSVLTENCVGFPLGAVLQKPRGKLLKIIRCVVEIEGGVLSRKIC